LSLLDASGFVIETGVEDEVDFVAKSYDLFNNAPNKLLFNSCNGPLEVDVGNVFGLEGNIEVVLNLVSKMGNDVFKDAGKDVG
jgi:hypothetical protein